MGLNIVLLPADGRAAGSGTTFSSFYNDKATESPRIAIRREAVPEGQTGKRISIAVVGHWAEEVDKVNLLVGASDFLPVIVVPVFFRPIPRLLHTTLPYRHKNTPLVSVRLRYLLGLKLSFMTDRIYAWGANCGAVSSMQWSRFMLTIGLTHVVSPKDWGFMI